jgi:anaerobic magnesium-protoporphyrin IX monomethyl ester cyclase
MKVTLISLNRLNRVSGYGVRILSSCLKKDGHDTQIIFSLRQGLSPRRQIFDELSDKTLEQICRLSRGSGFVGLSVMTDYFYDAVKITEYLRKDTSAPIVWGGIHPTIRPAECLEYADVVCVGEAEDTIRLLAKKIERGEDYKDIDGISFKNKEGKVVTKLGPLIEDLDSVPFPDYSNRGHYAVYHGEFSEMNEARVKKISGGYYETIATRGCPYGCAFCCNNTFNKMYPHPKRIRKRSINNLIEEILVMKERTPFFIRVCFNDDAFFLAYTVEEIENFCHQYVHKIGIPFDVSGITPASIDAKKMSLLIGAGMTSARLGIQSANEATRELYKRHHSVQQIQEAIRIIHGFKDKIKPPRYDFILDNPWESDEDIVATLRFIARIPAPYSLNLFSLTFYPGTELYEKAKAEGIIEDGIKNLYSKYSYVNIKPTYLNSLFPLISFYAARGIRIPAGIIFLLTQKTLRRLKISGLLYYFLFAGKKLILTLSGYLKKIRKHT